LVKCVGRIRAYDHMLWNGFTA